MNMRPIERPCVREVKRSRTFPPWQQDSNRRFAKGSCVSSRSQSIRARPLSNRPQSRTSVSLVCRLSNTPACDVSSRPKSGKPQLERTISVYVRQAVWVTLCRRQSPRSAADRTRFAPETDVLPRSPLLFEYDRDFPDFIERSLRRDIQDYWMQKRLQRETADGGATASRRQRRARLPACTRWSAFPSFSKARPTEEEIDQSLNRD